MPYGCSVPNCQVNYANGPKVSVFSFPEDEIQRQKWIRAIRRDNFQPTRNSKVCELHFQQQDVERETSMYDSKTGRLLTAPLSKPRLVKGAVPSVFPICPLFMKKTTARREDPEARRTRKENEQMSQSSNECSPHGAIIIKEEPVLNDWESTDGISSATDSPSIKKEEFSPPEDICVASTSSVDGMKAKGDDGGSWSDDCVEEIEVEVELRTGGSESESTAAVDAEDSNSVKDSDGSVTKYNAPYGNESATGNVVHRCAICRKEFANFEDLKEHTHDGSHEIPHSCSICCRSFKRAEHLKKHFRVHTGERPHSCNICSRKFAERSNLKRHLRAHTGERPYSCLVCNKTFLSSTCLKRHSQQHTGERPYRCSICNKGFSTSTCLKRHSQMHLDKPPYNCDVCLRQFKEIKSLRLHYRTHMRV